jgi:hypothetical protein
MAGDTKPLIDDVILGDNRHSDTKGVSGRLNLLAVVLCRLVYPKSVRFPAVFWCPYWCHVVLGGCRVWGLRFRV